MLTMLNCHLHDYIELSCLYRLPIRVMLKEGGSVEGVAKDVVLNDQRQECLLLDDKENECLIILVEIKSMQALQKNSHFDLIEFEEDKTLQLI